MMLNFIKRNLQNIENFKVLYPLSSKMVKLVLNIFV